MYSCTPEFLNLPCVDYLKIIEGKFSNAALTLTRRLHSHSNAELNQAHVPT